MGARRGASEVFSDDADRREHADQDSTNMFRVLIKTLLHAGIITKRTRAALRGVGRHGRTGKAEGDGNPGRRGGRRDAW